MNLKQIAPLFRSIKSLQTAHADLLRNVYARSGSSARLLRHPVPLRAPWRSPRLDLRRGKGIGDVLLCTPALRELKRRNPACIVRFFTDSPAVLRGLPYIDEVHPTAAAPAGSLLMRYENATPTRVHLARVLGDQLGLTVTDILPDCAVDPVRVEQWKEAWSPLPRPHAIVLRGASDWTPNKNWPVPYWIDLAQSLSHTGTVIEIGAPDLLPIPPSGSYVDLRGRTDLEDLVAAIAAADLYVGPISGPMHIAAAMRKRAVVIVGGYEHPHGVQYPGQTYLYTSLPCSPLLDARALLLGPQMPLRHHPRHRRRPHPQNLGRQPRRHPPDPPVLTR